MELSGMKAALTIKRGVDAYYVVKSGHISGLKVSPVPRIYPHKTPLPSSSKHPKG